MDTLAPHSLDVEAIRLASPIEEVVAEHVDLRRRGDQLFGLCPFHSESTPSFAVHPAKRVYHCFGCGVGGDVFDFVERRFECDFRTAVEYLAERAGLATELSAEQRVQIAAGEAHRRETRARAEQFEQWRDTCQRILTDHFRELGRSAERAKQVLARFSDCEPAWGALAEFYHQEAELSAALDLLCFEKASPWLERPMTRERLAAAFDDACRRCGENANVA